MPTTLIIFDKSDTAPTLQQMPESGVQSLTLGYEKALDGWDMYVYLQPDDGNPTLIYPEGETPPARVVEAVEGYQG